MKKTVFITGGSRGIGCETAIAFAKEGYDIGFTYLKSYEKAMKIKRDIQDMGANCSTYEVDVSDYESVDSAIKKFIAKHKKIDVLICNAGVSTYGTIDEIQNSDIKITIDTNVYGVINTCKAVSKHMISEKNGVIINLSSVWGMVGASCESVYSASKGAVIAFSKSLAKELGLSNIRVNVLAPGVVMTDMMSDFSKEDISAIKDMSAMQRVSSSQEMAKIILFLCSDEAVSFTGQVISPNCGLVI